LARRSLDAFGFPPRPLSAPLHFPGLLTPLLPYPPRRDPVYPAQEEKGQLGWRSVSGLNEHDCRARPTIGRSFHPPRSTSRRWGTIGVALHRIKLGFTSLPITCNAESVGPRRNPLAAHARGGCYLVMKIHPPHDGKPERASPHVRHLLSISHEHDRASLLTPGLDLSTS